MHGHFLFGLGLELSLSIPGQTGEMLYCMCLSQAAFSLEDLNRFWPPCHCLTLLSSSQRPNSKVLLHPLSDSASASSESKFVISLYVQSHRIHSLYTPNILFVCIFILPRSLSTTRIGPCNNSKYPPSAPNCRVYLECSKVTQSQSCVRHAPRTLLLCTTSKYLNHLEIFITFSLGILFSLKLDTTFHRRRLLSRRMIGQLHSCRKTWSSERSAILSLCLWILRL